MQGRLEELHSVGFVRRFEGLGWLEERIREGTLRAGAQLLTGPYEAVLFASESLVLPAEEEVVPRSDPPPTAPESDDGEGTVAPVASADYQSAAMAEPLTCDETNEHTFPCNFALYREVLRVASRGMPALHVAFAVAEIAPAQQRAWAATVAEQSDSVGVWSAAGLLSGFPRGNALVEVVGNRFSAVHDRLLEILDVPMVTSFDTMHTTGRLTRGFAGEPVR